MFQNNDSKRSPNLFSMYSVRFMALVTELVDVSVSEELIQSRPRLSWSPFNTFTSSASLSTQAENTPWRSPSREKCTRGVREKTGN